MAHQLFTTALRLVECVGVVDHRQNDRQRALDVGFGEPVVLDRTHVEVAAVSAPGQIELRDAFGERIELRIGAGLLQLADLVILEVGLVGHQHAVETPGPARRQGEPALSFDGAAPVAEARGQHAVVVDEVLLVELVDARGPERQVAFLEALPILRAQQRTLFRGDARRDREVVIGREREVVRRFDAEAVGRARRYDRHQEAGLALHAGIGRGEIGEVRQRDAEELDPGVLEVHHLVGLVVNDADRLDLPQRRLERIVLAGFAGGVDATREHRVVGAGAFGARGRHPRVVDRLEAQRIDEAVAEVVGEIELLAVADLAVGFGEPRVAFGMQALGALVVDHLVGFDRRAVVVDLDVAGRRHEIVGVVIANLVSLDEHLSVDALLLGEALARGLGAQLVAKIEEVGLRDGRRQRRNAGRERRRHGEHRRGETRTATPSGRACCGRAHHHSPPRFNNGPDPAIRPHCADAAAPAMAAPESTMQLFTQAGVTIDANPRPMPPQSRRRASRRTRVAEPVAKRS
jgi:hypothetical protein